MSRLLSLGVAVSVVVWLMVGRATAEYTVKGVVLTSKSKTLVATTFLLQKEGVTVNILTSGQTVVVPFEKISRLVVLNYEGTQHWLTISEAILFLKEGKKLKVSFKAEQFGRGRRGFHYIAVNPVTDQLERQYIDFKDVSEILFDEDYGNLREDSEGNLFPPHYLYSPYTGKPMRLVPIE